MALDVRADAWVQRELAKGNAYWSMLQTEYGITREQAGRHPRRPTAPGLSAGAASELEAIRRRVLVDTMTARMEQDAAQRMREARRGRL